jgi:hypothetical protein
MPCNPNRLTWHKPSQTSSGITSNTLLDREGGSYTVVQHPSFDLVLSETSVSFRTDLYRLTPDRLMLWLKCLLLIQTLSEAALEEASRELEEIARFYMNRMSGNVSTISTSVVKGKLEKAQIRPHIVLEP